MSTDRTALVYRHPWTGGLRGAETTVRVTADGLVEETLGRARRVAAADVERICVDGAGLHATLRLVTRAGPVSLRLPRLAASEATRLAAAMRTRWRLAA
jgi:hypothetical protein